jgi:5'-nucleotidase
MHLLLTNDDGVDAPGLAALEDVCRPLGRTTVVAPIQALSGCSHRVTTDRSIRVVRHNASRYAVDGTPADCVRVALDKLTDGVTWVLSGVNAGGNLGADVHHSGTVAAAREAALHGLPAVAVSHYRKKDLHIDWQRVFPWIEGLLADLTARAHVSGTFWNINLPHLNDGQPTPEAVFCPLDPSPLPLSFTQHADGYVYDGSYHQRVRRPGTDVDVCFSGRIAVTQLSTV